MIISQENKVAYIGIPHTGSTFIHKSCYDVSRLKVYDDLLKHGKVSDCLKNGAEKNYKFYLFVRNPIEWVKREWALLHKVASWNDIDYIKKQKETRWKNKCLDFYKNRPSIDNFIISYIDNYYKDSIFDSFIDDDCEVIYLHYEDFTNSCSILFDSLNVPIPNFSKKVNSSEGIDLTIKKSTEQKIASRFRKDMKKFGYME